MSTLGSLLAIFSVRFSIEIEAMLPFPGWSYVKVQAQLRSPSLRNLPSLTATLPAGRFRQQECRYIETLRKVGTCNTLRSD